MTDAPKKDRTPLLASLAAMTILGGLGSYLYFRQNANATAPSGATQAADAAVSAAGMSDVEKKATEAIVRAYILENPEILSEAAAILQQRDAAKRLASAGGAITKPFAGAEAGNPNGDVTLVEFTDYSCGYCRSSLADVQNLVGSDKGLRVVYRELPILSPASKEAAKWALAAAKQGKHKAFHDAMFAGEKPSEASIKLAASKAGLDMARAAQDANSQAVADEINANLKMAQQVGFGGTPTFIVGDQVLEGAVGYDAIKAAIAKVRDKS
jgi:protein-disulfide isomerase